MNNIITPFAPLFNEGGIVTVMDIAHMYVGQFIEVIPTNEDRRHYGDKIIGQIVYSFSDVIGLTFKDKSGVWDDYEINDSDENYKIFLKDKCDMPIDIKKKYKELCFKVVPKPISFTYCETPQSILFLIKNGYDAFGLLNTGFEIDYQLLDFKTIDK